MELHLIPKTLSHYKTIHTTFLKNWNEFLSRPETTDEDSLLKI